MKTLKKSKEISLSPKHVEALTELAKAHGMLSRGGPKSGLPSWQAMIVAIAEGSLQIDDCTTKDRKERKEKKPRKFSPHPRFAAKWWKPNEVGDMSVADAVAASGFSVEDLVAGGMQLVDGGTCLLPGAAWKGWA